MTTRIHTRTPRIGHVLLIASFTASLLSLPGIAQAQRPKPDLTEQPVHLEPPTRERGTLIPLAPPTDLKSQAMQRGSMSGSACGGPINKSSAKRSDDPCSSVHAQQPKGMWAGTNRPAAGEQ